MSGLIIGIVFIIFMLVEIAYFAKYHQPPEGWDKDPLPAAAEAGEKAVAQGQDVTPPEYTIVIQKAPALDLEI